MAQSLLLGLGGTGSRVVNYVAADLRKNRIPINNGQISIAVLDTNANDQDKIKDSGTAIPVIATGKDRTIENYIRFHSEEDVTQWLPESPTFLMETTIDGASQMRPKSRLAFMDVMTSNELKELEEVIEKLFDYKENSKIRVMIVSSLAGGTGSGMFIQTALWLRKFFREHACEVTIRGIFVLPDVFIHTVNDIQNDPKEQKSLYANAYGAIREMNAITKILTKDFVPSAPIRIDGLFDSTTDAKKGKPLYDYAFFVDDIAADGTVLNDIALYERTIARLVYMQLYAPMHNDLYSEEDNLFKLFEQSDEPMFGSCGAAKAVYPTEDIVRYCALRAAKDSISSGWLRINHEIAEKLAREKEKEKNGSVIRVRLDPRKEYIRLYEEKTSLPLDKIGKDRLFYNIRHDAMIEDKKTGKDGRIAVKYKSKVDGFLTMMGEMIVKKVDTDHGSGFTDMELSEQWIESDNDNTPESLKTLSELKQAEVNEFLENWREKVVQPLAESLCDRICPMYFNDVNCNNEDSLMHLFTKSGDAGERVYIHPLALRYLLYKLKFKFDEIQDNILLKELEESAEKGHGPGMEEPDFDNPKTKRNTETTPKEYLESITSGRGEKVLIKDFKVKLRSHVNTQVELCRKYAIESLQYWLSEFLEQRVEKLIMLTEKFFDQLESVIDRIDKDIADNVKANSEVTQKMIYVCASAEEKEALYQSLMTSSESGDAINRSVAEAIYQAICYEEKRDTDTGSIMTRFYMDMVRYFQTQILTEYKDEVDLDIYTAVCKSADIAYEKANAGKKPSEAELLAIDWENGEVLPDTTVGDRHKQAMKDLVNKLTRLSEPLLICKDFVDGDEHLKPDDKDGDEVLAKDKNGKIFTKRKKFWGFHPDIVAKCPELGKFLGVNTETQSNEAYSKNELDCYRAIYGVLAEQIDKFNEKKNGAYYRSYRNIVRQMVIGEANGQKHVLVQTPHLDKTWHYFLPYVSAAKQREEEFRFYRYFWFALAYGMITVTGRGKFQILRKKKNSIGIAYEENELLTYMDDPIDRLDVDKLLGALRRDPFFLEDAEKLEEIYIRECGQTTYENTVFMNGMKVRDSGDDADDVETAETAETKKRVVIEGGLETKSDVNAVTVIVRYDNTREHDNDITAALIYALEELLRGLAENKYEKNETDKVRRAGYELCHRIYKASALKNKDVDLFRGWKHEWSRAQIDE